MTEELAGQTRKLELTVQLRRELAQQNLAEGQLVVLLVSPWA